MTIEHLAFLGIAVFAFMAVINLFTALRTLKRSRPSKATRIRRLISSPDAAMALAQSVVQDIANKHTDDVIELKAKGRFNESLQTSLEKGRQYYLSRVDSINRDLFSRAVDELLEKSSKTADE